MQNLRWPLASMLVVLTVCPCPASENGSKPEIAITLEQPKADFVLGKPIPLTVVFQNNLERDVRIEDFNPEFGIGSCTGKIQVTYALTRKGCVSTEAWRKEVATTLVDVKRLSGKALKRERSFSSKDVKGRSFLLKAGVSEKQQFDLMQTLAGAMEIDSSGRFKVFLEFTMEVKTSEGYLVEPSDWNWAGEVRTKPIEITVVSDKK